MTDEQHGPSKALATLTTGTGVTAIVPQTFDDVYRFAKVLAQSGMTPYGMKTEQQVAVALFHGLELGLPPMQAIQSIAVINGRPSLWGDAIMALIRRSGELEQFEESIEGEIPPSTVDLKDWPDTITAVCTMKRRGEKPVTRKYSVGNARRAKLWMKKSAQGGDSPWITNPERMLTVRARSFTSRDAFQDTLRGFQTVEEMQDAIEVEYREVKPAATTSAVANDPPPAEPDVSREAPQAPADNAPTAEAPAPEAEETVDWDRALAHLESEIAATSNVDAIHAFIEAMETEFGNVPRWIMTKAQGLVETRLAEIERAGQRQAAQQAAPTADLDSEPAKAARKPRRARGEPEASAPSEPAGPPPKPVQPAAPAENDEAPSAGSDDPPPAPSDDAPPAGEPPAADAPEDDELPPNLTPAQIADRVEVLVGAMRKSKTLEALKVHIDLALKMQSAKLLTGQQEDELREIIRSRKKLLQGAK